MLFSKFIAACLLVCGATAHTPTEKVELLALYENSLTEGLPEGMTNDELLELITMDQARIGISTAWKTGRKVNDFYKKWSAKIKKAVGMGKKVWKEVG